MKSSLTPAVAILTGLILTACGNMYNAPGTQSPSSSGQPLVAAAQPQTATPASATAGKKSTLPTPKNLTFCGSEGSLAERIADCERINGTLAHQPEKMDAWTLVQFDGRTGKQTWMETETQIVWGPALDGEHTFMEALVLCNDSGVDYLNRVPTQADFERVLTTREWGLFPQDTILDWSGPGTEKLPLEKKSEIQVGFWTSSAVLADSGAGTDKKPVVHWYSYNQGFGKTREFQSVSPDPETKMFVRCVGQGEGLPQRH